MALTADDANGGAPPVAAGRSRSNEERLAAWERHSRPAIVAAAIVPLVGVSSGTDHYGLIGDLVEVACWLVFLVDLVVHMRLRPGYLRTGYGKFDLAVVVLTSPWYLLPGVDGGQLVTLLRLARLARVLMIGFQAPVIRKTLQRLGRPAVYAGIMLMVCSAITMRAEDHQHGFKTYGDSLWWGVVTITTVGYGDLVPESRLGRLAATVLMITGVAVLGTVAASLASMFRLEDRATEEGAAAGEQGSAAPASPESATMSLQAPGPVGTPDAAVASVAEELRALRAEVAALREEIVRRPPDA